MAIIDAIFGGIHSFFVGVLVFIVIVLVAILFAKGYVKAEPDEALVITGRGSRPRVVIGRAVVRIPFLQSKPSKLTLRPIRVDLTTDDWVPTSDFIGAKVAATVNVKVDTTSDDTVLLAAQHWTGMEAAAIAGEIRNTLEGSVKEIIGKMALKDAATDRKKFGDEVLQSAQPDMEKLGLQVLTFNMKSLQDNQGVLDALGMENESQIKKTAAIAAANAKKEVREQKAAAEQEANRAENESLMAIAERENDLLKKKADLKKESDAMQAQADIAYALQQEEARQELERRTVEADIARQEKEVELEAQRVALQERKLEAEKQKTADAELYERQRKAEAELYEREKAAEADRKQAELDALARKAQSDADLYAKEQEAKGIRALGEAEAERERAVGVAKADALEREAEAMERLGHAALGKMLIEKLPEIAHELASPMASIDSVKVIGGGNGETGINAYADTVPVAMARLFETVRETTGVDMNDLVAGDGLKAATERDVNVNGVPRIPLEERMAAARERLSGSADDDE